MSEKWRASWQQPVASSQQPAASSQQPKHTRRMRAAARQMRAVHSHRPDVLAMGAFNWAPFKLDERRDRTPDVGLATLSHTAICKRRLLWAFAAKSLSPFVGSLPAPEFTCGAFVGLASECVSLSLRLSTRTSRKQANIRLSSVERVRMSDCRLTKLVSQSIGRQAGYTFGRKSR